MRIMIPKSVIWIGLIALIIFGLYKYGGNLQMNGNVPNEASSVQIQNLIFAANTGTNMTLAAVVNDVNHARASLADNVSVTGNTGAMGLNLTVMRVGSEHASCPVKVISPDFKNLVSTSDSNGYNIITKDAIGFLKIYVNGVQVMKGYTMGWTDGQTSQNLAVTAEISNTALLTQPQYTSNLITLDVCGTQYRVEIVSTTA